MPLFMIEWRNMDGALVGDYEDTLGPEFRAGDTAHFLHSLLWFPVVQARV